MEAQARLNADVNRKLRVDRLKRMLVFDSQTTQKQRHNLDDPEKPWEQRQVREEIAVLRETRNNIRLGGGERTESGGSRQHVPMVPGKPEFVRIKLHNDSEKAKTYQIAIEDPDAGLLPSGQAEVRLISAPDEQEFWAKRKVVPLGASDPVRPPLSYDMIADPSGVVLQAGEKIELLLRCQTFRDVATGDYSTSEVMAKRTAKVTVYSGNVALKELALELVPVCPPIDHTFRFDQPQDSAVKVAIPPLVQFRESMLGLRSSSPYATVKLDAKTQELQVETTVGQSEISFLVFAFAADKATSAGEMLLTFRIVIAPLPTVYMQVMAGVESVVDLPIVSTDKAAEIFLYSSERAVYLEKEGKSFNIEAGHKMQHLQMKVRACSLGPQKIKINAIGKFNFLTLADKKGKLFYQWLLMIATLRPHASMQRETKKDEEPKEWVIE